MRKINIALIEKVGAFLVIGMQYVYYLSFVYLDKKGKQLFGDTLYDYEGGIKTENDVRDIAALLQMRYNTKHLRILSFSLMKVTSTYETLKNMFKDFLLFEFFSAPRLRQKLRAWKKGKGWRKKC